MNHLKHLLFLSILCSNPMELIMNADNSVTAVFELLDTDGDGVTDDVDTCEDTPEGDTVDENGCHIDPLVLDENGVTIKATIGAVVGESYEFDGITFTVVDSLLLKTMILNNDNISVAVTSRITNMANMFGNNTEFNQDISSWDVSNVINMQSMFTECILFNQNINSWDVSNVTSMDFMFTNCASFNQPLNEWDVSNITNMSFMFFSGFTQNQSLIDELELPYLTSNWNIENWNVSSVTTMANMLENHPTFNLDLSSWDVSNVTDCSYFSTNATAWTEPKPNFTNCTE